MDFPLFFNSPDDTVHTLDDLLDQIRSDEEAADFALQVKKEVDETLESEYVEPEDVKEEIKEEVFAEDIKVKIEVDETLDMKEEFAEDIKVKIEVEETLDTKEDFAVDIKKEVRIKQEYIEDEVDGCMFPYQESPKIKTENDEQNLPPISALLEGVIAVSDAEMSVSDEEFLEEGEIVERSSILKKARKPKLERLRIRGSLKGSGGRVGRDHGGARRDARVHGGRQEGRRKLCVAIECDSFFNYKKVH